jgi:hypothetical protein
MRPGRLRPDKADSMEAFARRSTSARLPALLALLLVPMSAFPNCAHAQTPTWQLWASGLPGGYRPRIAVAPDHSIYYGLLSASAHGILYKAGNALAPSGSFAAMPPIPYLSITNNIAALTTSANSEPVVGIFHGLAAQNLTDPIAFVFDGQQWITATVSVPANLGVFAMARAPNGDLWFGAKWSRVYRSTDNGRSYTAIDETALVAASAPCYYPAIDGNPSDGAIYSINVDRRGWVYAGTEGAGVVYSSTMFLHSGPNAAFDPNPPPPPQTSLYSMGLYSSSDGIHWTQSNAGITGNNNGGSEGSLAVDGNRVFTATSDGKIWYLDTVDVIFANGFDG